MKTNMVATMEKPMCTPICFKTLIRTRRYRRTLIRLRLRFSSCPPDQLQPQGVPDPRQTQLHPTSRTSRVPDCKRPVRIRAARDPDCNSSRSTISCSRLQPQSVRVLARSCSARIQLVFLPSSRFILLVVRFQQFTKLKYLEISLAGETKQVELEYEKLDKHCLSCLSLSHEVKDCPSRTTSRNTADQNLGISQRRMLERIEENRRRTNNRKLSRFSPYDDPRTHRGSAPTHVNQSQYGHERNETRNHHYTERKEHSSDRSYSNRPYSIADNREKDSARSREPRDRLPPVRESSEVSLRSRGMRVANPATKNVWRPVSEGHGNGDHSNSIQSQVSHTPSPHPPRERITTPINTPQETSRPSGEQSGTPPSRRPALERLSNADIISPTGERLSALARISTPAPRVPLLQNGVANSESGRLQEVNIQYLEEMFPHQTPEAESIPSSSRAPPKVIPIDAGIMERSPIRTLSEDRAHVSLRLGLLPVSVSPSPTPQALKAVGKKKKAAYLEISLAGETKQVELEYEKLDKHCFSCLSLSHEVKDCPSRTTSRNTADQSLGISQRRTLERIEENRRRTDNRKLSRFSPYDDPRTHRGSAPTHVNQSQYGHERNETRHHHYSERKEHSSDRSYSNRPYAVADNREKDSARAREPRDRLPPVRESSEVSLRSRGMRVANPAAKNVWRPVSEGHGNGDHFNSIQSQVSHTPSPHPPRGRITTPINTPQETSRPSGEQSGTPPSRRPALERLSNADIISPTGERRSALARISTPAPRVPLLQNGVANSESGRLQEVNIQYLEEMFPYQTPEAESIPSSSRSPPKAIPIDAGIMESFCFPLAHATSFESGGKEGKSSGNKTETASYKESSQEPSPRHQSEQTSCD
ncbi:hypothetical protein DY000_02029370 [Brassica cretica]|uniref:Zinc knuckle CX2CX4HX4C domain-containing protein n=1 Tax=Brassica cretica TaxID=69181 RepID=A0ABQ7DRP0_BRACR|nr:hypothetical protein DY000_02029370 [Brassica cretica]